MRPRLLLGKRERPPRKVEAADECSRSQLIVIALANKLSGASPRD